MSVVLDQVVKFALYGTEYMLLPGVVRITATLNMGFSLGLMPNSTLPALILSILVLGALLVFLRLYRLAGLSRIGMSLLVGGAMGNLIDRIFLGGVRDMFELSFFNNYVCNVADFCVTIGAGLIIIGILRNKKEWEKR